MNKTKPIAKNVLSRSGHERTTEKEFSTAWKKPNKLVCRLRSKGVPEQILLSLENHFHQGNTHNAVVFPFGASLSSMGQLARNQAEQVLTMALNKDSPNVIEKLSRRDSDLTDCSSTTLPEQPRTDGETEVESKRGYLCEVYTCIAPNQFFV